MDLISCISDSKLCISFLFELSLTDSEFVVFLSDLGLCKYLSVVSFFLSLSLGDLDLLFGLSTCDSSFLLDLCGVVDTEIFDRFWSSVKF